MELKRPFSDEDFQATSGPVRRYIIQLEDVVIKLLQETKDLQLLCHWANVFPDDQEWRDFYQRFTDLIFDHEDDKGEVGTMARSLIRQMESLWLFLDIDDVDPTNNLAERVLRYGVLDIFILPTFL